MISDAELFTSLPHDAHRLVAFYNQEKKRREESVGEIMVLGCFNLGTRIMTSIFLSQGRDNKQNYV
jgi:hypothetical protein